MNPSGVELGRLDSIMIELPAGRIAYAILAFGGVCGIGERHYAVPWIELTRDAARRCFVLDRAPEELENTTALNL